MGEFPRSERNKVRRLPKRGAYDEDSVNAILDEGYLCHVGFRFGEQPFIIPTLYARAGRSVFVHGSAVSRMLGRLAEGVEMCLAVTLVDGIVLARSAFHHSMNYRSAVCFGKGRPVEEKDAKLEALRLISEKVMPGRWEDARSPTERELEVTSVVEIVIDEASAKTREGDPIDDKEDYDLPVWAGVVPLVQSYGEPLPDTRLREGIGLPEYLRKLV